MYIKGLVLPIGYDVPPAGTLTRNPFAALIR